MQTTRLILYYTILSFGHTLSCRYKKMLQCRRCHQWFHQKCIRNPALGTLLFGDRFYKFVCTLCTGTCEEIIERLPLSWTDALTLVLFNLTVIHSKKHHDIETAIIPFFKRKLKSLQCSASVLKSSRVEANHIHAILTSNKSRFKPGSQHRKGSTFWGLKDLVPPMPGGGKNSSSSSGTRVHFLHQVSSFLSGASTVSTSNLLFPLQWST